MALALAAVPSAAADPAPAAATADSPHAYGEPVAYPMVFPVGGSDFYYADDALLGFGACRDGCARTHEGVDILSPKLTPVYAVADRTVAWLGTRCCSVFLLHDDGWQSYYIHLNNDSPGTDDGRGWGIAGGVAMGARVAAGQLIGWVGDSGNAEETAPHLHFELVDPYWVKVDPFPALAAAEGQANPVCAGQELAPMALLLDDGGVLRRGMVGGAVQELQGFLAVRGLQVGALDGVFGEQTERALRAFQELQGLTPDGIAGPLTRSAVGAVTQRAAFASLLDPGGRLLTLGSRGTDVRELKRWLRAAGHHPGPAPYGSDFDEATAAAVSAFQAAAGIAADGKVGPLTRRALLKALGLTHPGPCG